MATFAVSMVKDEVDIIEGWVKHLSGEVDEIIVADNGSKDGTRELLHELQSSFPLTVLHDENPAYYQSQKMTHLASIAGERGATWILPVDADELWFNRGDRIRDILRATVVGNVVKVPLYNHFSTALDLKVDDRFRAMVWRQRSSGALPKVAYRWHPAAVIHQGNHGVDHPAPFDVPINSLEIRHFPYRTESQFISKALNGSAAYKYTNLPTDVGAHWRAYGDLHARFGRQALVDVYREHFWFLSPTDSGMVLDPAPYCRWK